MAIFEYIEAAKKQIADMKRKYKFNKANKEREKAAELLNDTVSCKGKLEVCKEEFNSVIKKQSKAILDGRTKGMDTNVQKNMLWDAAIGYLLVKDAIFAIDSVTSNDGLAHAYDLLDVATCQMKGKKPKGSIIPGVISKMGERDSYGFLSAETTLHDKEKYLESFFEELICSGDIEFCINKTKPSALHDGDQYYNATSMSTSGGSDLDSDMEAINAMMGSSKSSNIDSVAAFDSITTAHIPTKKGE